MSMLAYHHKELLTFLKEVRDTTPEFSFIASHSEEWKLFNIIIDAGNAPIQQAMAAMEIGKSASYLRKTTQPKLNDMLRAFSDKCGIKPPIQLYFNTMKDYPGGHFACCDDLKDNASKSQNFMRLADLQKQIENARLFLELEPIASKSSTPDLQNVENISDLNINKISRLEGEDLNNIDFGSQQNMENEFENESLRRLYMQVSNELEEIQKALVRSSDEQTTKMFQDMWELKNKQLLDISIKLNMFNVLDDNSPKQLRKLRKELGLNEDGGI